MKEKYKLTQEHLDDLNKELIHLKTVRGPEVAEQIKEARSFGDLSENSEYDEAKNEQGKVFSRIAEIESIINNCVIIDFDTHGTATVMLGCSVVVEDAETSEREEYTIVGSQEADPANMRVSDVSPFGKALIGHGVGEEVTLEVPAGKFIYRILEIK